MKKLREIFVYIFFNALIIDYLEEIIEDFIAYTISEVLLKVFSTMIVVTITYSIKVLLKRMIKKITYKEGNDKVNKIKSFITTLWQNKGTIGGVITAGLAVASGTKVIDVSQFPALMIGTFNITPWLYYGAIAIAIIWCTFFPESKEEYEKRIAEKNAKKEAKVIEKIAKKEIKEEAKKANQSQAQQEKAEAKEAKDKAEAEAKAKAEEEKRAKIDAVKAEILKKEKEKTDIPNA